MGGWRKEQGQLRYIVCAAVPQPVVSDPLPLEALAEVIKDRICNTEFLICDEPSSLAMVHREALATATRCVLATLNMGKGPVIGTSCSCYQDCIARLS